MAIYVYWNTPLKLVIKLNAISDANPNIQYYHIFLVIYNRIDCTGNVIMLFRPETLTKFTEVRCANNTTWAFMGK